MNKVFSIILAVVFLSAAAGIFAQEQSGTVQTVPEPDPADASAGTMTPEQPQQEQEVQGQQGAGSPFVSESLVKLGEVIGQPVSGTEGGQAGTIRDVVLSSDGMIEFVVVDLQAQEAAQAGAGGQLGSGEAAAEPGTEAGSGEPAESPDTAGPGEQVESAEQPPQEPQAEMREPEMREPEMREPEMRDSEAQAGSGDQGDSTAQAASTVESGAYLVPVTSFSIQNRQITLNMQDMMSFQPESRYGDTVGTDSIRLSQLREYQVTEGVQGSVIDVVADLQNGEVQYVVFSDSGALGAGESFQAVPFENVWYNRTDRTVRVDAAQERIQSFGADSWPTELSAGQSLGSGEAETAPVTPDTAATVPETGTVPETETAPEPAPQTETVPEPAPSTEGGATGTEGVQQ